MSFPVVVHIFYYFALHNAFQIQSGTARSGFKKRAKFITVLDVQRLRHRESK